MDNQNKKELRKNIIAARDRLSSADIKQRSGMIAERLYASQFYRQAQSIMFFVTFGSEVDTRSMMVESIRRNKTVLAPKAVRETRELLLSRVLDWNDDLEPGAYGIPEPKSSRIRPFSPENLDLVMVPGVAFDPQGNRLGYGGGYYDRFFPLLKKSTPLVGLAFELQVVPEVPVEQWDRRIDMLVTETRLLVY